MGRSPHVGTLDALILEVAMLSLPVSDILAHDTFTILTLVFIVSWHPLDYFVAEPEPLSLDKVELIAHVPNSILEPIAPQATI